MIDSLLPLVLAPLSKQKSAVEYSRRCSIVAPAILLQKQHGEGCNLESQQADCNTFTSRASLGVPDYPGKIDQSISIHCTHWHACKASRYRINWPP